MTWFALAGWVGTAVAQYPGQLLERGPARDVLEEMFMISNCGKCLFAAAALVFAGCRQSGIPSPQPIQDRVALEAFSSCSELQKYIADTAVLDMRSQLEQAKQYGGGSPLAMGGEGPRAADAPQAQGPSSYTQTNVQVAGVDEADFVKNDGTRILVLSGEWLYLNQSWPPAQLQTVSRVQIEGWPREMFLDESNHVVVFSSVYTPYPLTPLPMSAIACRPMDCGYYYGTSTKVTVLDVSDFAHASVVDQFYLPGGYNTSRRVGSAVRVVLSDNFHWPLEVKWWPDYDPALYQDQGRLARALDDLMASNEAIIRRQPLDAWLPPAKRKLPDGSMVDIGYNCKDFFKTNAPTRLGIVTIASLDLTQPDQLSRTSIVGEPGQVYASPSSLYVASNHWWWWLVPGQVDHTYLHKFDITQPDKAIYVASGGAPGTILNQYSMDEDASGFFRIATNISTRVSDAMSPWGHLETTNRVSVLAEQSGALRVIGQTEELSPGERIFSTRFIGSQGFVVTFRQVDPLITIDLSDPQHPRKVGELTVPGFSTYIHPLDANHLLTLGQYIPASGDVRMRALKLSLFDVSDLSQPIEKFTQLVGNAWGWSEAAYEPKAFNYFPERKLLAIPFSDWNPYAGCATYWCAFVSDLRVFQVDSQTGIQPKGALDMRDAYESINQNGWMYYWAPYVRRSVLADNFAYAISDAGIRVADVDSLSQPIRTILFDRSGP
jgi:uncharacterized secreted protein with C-terminal beta-propeller domain